MSAMMKQYQYHNNILQEALTLQLQPPRSSLKAAFRIWVHNMCHLHTQPLKQVVQVVQSSALIVIIIIILTSMIRILFTQSQCGRALFISLAFGYNLRYYVCIICCWLDGLAEASPFLLELPWKDFFSAKESSAVGCLALWYFDYLPRKVRFHRVCWFDFLMLININTKFYNYATLLEETLWMRLW